MTSGVPQGSVLLLFTLFVSDIPSTVNNFCSLFADDTKIHSALYDAHNSCTTSLQKDLDRLQNWFLLLVSSGCLTGSWSVWSHAVTPHSTIYHLVFVI